jgi:acyl-CoA dehydrogenase
VAIIEELAEQGVGGFFLALHSDVVFPTSRAWARRPAAAVDPGCVQGDHVLALAMTEPGAGSDLARIATRAVRSGDHYVVDGPRRSSATDRPRPVRGGGAHRARRLAARTRG